MGQGAPVRVFLFGAVAGVALAGGFEPLLGTARADEVVLEPRYFTSHEECLVVLAEFSGFCSIYEGPMWARLYYKRPPPNDCYWALSEGFPAPAYRHDLDGDGTEDMIVAIMYGYGDRGWPPICGHFFLFGDQQPRVGAPRFGISAGGRPHLIERDGVASLFFESVPSRIHSIGELRERSISSPTMNMELP